jgi:hypothetical protein
MKKWLIFGVIVAMFAVVMFPACESGGDDAGIADSVIVERFFDHVADSDGGYAAGTKLVGYNIKWEGVPGYDYYAYYEIMDARGELQRGGTQIKGQTVFEFAPQTTIDTGTALKAPFVKVSPTSGKESWSIYACLLAEGADTTSYKTGGTGGYSGDVTLDLTGVEPPDHGAKVLKDFWDALVNVFDSSATPPGSEAAKFRIGVVPANPGGFPFEEQRTVKYSDWYDVKFDKATPPVAMYGEVNP